MQKELNVILVEDDPYARDLMSLLLRRDWRTHVAGEFGSYATIKLQQTLRQPSPHIDVILVDMEMPKDETWPFKVAQIIRLLPAAQTPIVLYTCTAPNLRTLSHILDTNGGGYIVKSEILYALASAVSAAARGNFVLTPGTHILAGELKLPGNTVLLDGTSPAASFTPREKELTRLGLLFNLTQREIADDLFVSTDFVAEVMGQIYRKLGLHEILSGEKALEIYFKDKNLLARCRDVLQQAPAPAGGKRKVAGMSSLAFHLLTIPGTTEIHLGEE